MQATGGNGEQLGQCAYAPFGEPLGASPARIGFSSELFDAGTRLAYYNYRHLAPGLGRWLGRDAIEEEGGVNLYAFINNNAIDKYDHLGMIDILFEYLNGDEVNEAYISQVKNINVSVSAQISRRAGFEVWPSETNCICKDKCGKKKQGKVFLTQKKHPSSDSQEWIYDTYASEIWNPDTGAVRIPAYTDIGYENPKDIYPKRGLKSMNHTAGYIYSPTTCGQEFLVQAWCRCFQYGISDILLGQMIITSSHSGL